MAFFFTLATGILFKFSEDSEGIFEHDADTASAKIAGHELKVAAKLFPFIFYLELTKKGGSKGASRCI